MFQALFFYNFHRFGHFCPKLAIWLDAWKSPFKGWKSLKNLKVGVFKTDLSKFHSYFRKQPVYILNAEDW